MHIYSMLGFIYNIKPGVANWYQSSADCRTLSLVRNSCYTDFLTLSLPFILIKAMLNSSSLFYWKGLILMLLDLFSLFSCVAWMKQMMDPCQSLGDYRLCKKTLLRIFVMFACLLLWQGEAQCHAWRRGSRTAVCAPTCILFNTFMASRYVACLFENPAKTIE